MKKILSRVILLLVLISLSGCSLNNDKTFSEKSNDFRMKKEMYDDKLIAIFNEYLPTLDGAFAEKFAYKLYEAYKKTDNRKFIYNLGSCEKSNIHGITTLLVSEALNTDGKNAIRELTSIYNIFYNDKSLTAKEKYIVYDIYTNILYFQLP